MEVVNINTDTQFYYLIWSIIFDKIEQYLVIRILFVFYNNV
jgi:hypothetical protein